MYEFPRASVGHSEKFAKSPGSQFSVARTSWRMPWARRDAAVSQLGTHMPTQLQRPLPSIHVGLT